MRIGLDVRYLSHGLVGGVHKFIRHLVPALIRAGEQHSFLLYADTKQPFELSDLPSNVTLRLLPYRNALSSVYNDLFMKRVIERDRLDIMHFPANYGFGPSNARTIITLHDEINILPWLEILRGHRKNMRVIAMMSYLHFCSTQALKHTQLLVTDSLYSKNNIIKNTSFDQTRITAIMFGADPSIQRIEDSSFLEDVRQRHRLDRPFVLADGIKNPASLVNAWHLVPANLRQQYQIIFFSRIPTPPAAVFEAQSAGYARLLIRPSNEDLMALYSMAQAFIFPSWIEGLGLPLLEAMTCGAPVIASNRGSIPEVVGEAGLITDVDDIEGIARHITTVLTNSDEAQRLRELGYMRAASFSWEKTARRYLETYKICHSAASTSTRLVP